MKRVLILGGFLIVGVAAVIALAQPVTDELYKPNLQLDKDITASAGEVAIEPKFKGVAGDLFGYEVDFKAVRRGTTSDDGVPSDAFRRSEHWATAVDYKLDEDVLDGSTDLRLAVRYARMNFLLDNGDARYSGYIGPDMGAIKPTFHEVMPDGSRTEVNNIPGWDGVNARTINTNRQTQANDPAAVAWFSITDQSRLYDEVYFADYNSPDQRNYPGRFQDPVQLTLGLFPEFPAGAKLKIGETVNLRRRMPVGAVAGATTEYDVSYKLEKLYGTIAEPTAARFSFTAVPVAREHTAQVNGLTVKFSAPDFQGGTLLLDLAKGVPAHVHWSYSLKGSIAGEGKFTATFENEVDFTASLRADRAKTPE
ncbi:MAG: hypothetical protein IPK87_08890 [Planctomycetes bacterium]|nr:hypothetical protein [Planctomycetota bacterium]